MSVDLKLPFAQFLYAYLAEYAKTNNLPHLSSRIWLEETARAHDEWHAYRKPKKKPSAAFIPPTPAEVTAYSIEINYPLDGVAWCLGYEMKGWKTSGSAKMSNWRLAVQKWKREGFQTKHKPQMPPKPLPTDVPVPEPPDWLARLPEGDEDKKPASWEHMPRFYQLRITRKLAQLEHA